MTDANVNCRCGKVHLTIQTGGPGKHLKCYCKYCQGFARHFGEGQRLLDTRGGTSVFQLSPHRVEIAKGTDELAWFKLSEKGVMRWYANCCGTPLLNTLETPKLPLISLLTGNVHGVELGPVKYHSSVENAAPGAVLSPAGRVALAGIVLGFLGRVIAARLSGNWRKNPFFGPDKMPITPMSPLSKEARDKAVYPDGRA